MRYPCIVIGSLPLLRDIGLALAIGLLVGVERGWSLRGEPDGSRVAGLRTFALLGIAGGVAGMLGSNGQPLLAAALLAGIAAILVIGYRRTIDAGEAGGSSGNRVGATTAVAALLTLGLGALATLGLAVPALVIAVAATLLLSQRHRLHDWLRGMSETDIQAVVRFAVIAGAVWPLLPDEDMGPWNAWNPRDLWFVVVIVCGLSFAGYVAGRRFGAARGTLATAAIGGLYSSTAVTAALSQQMRANPDQVAIFSAGIAVASAVMFARVLLLTAILVPFALPRLAMIVGPAALVAPGFVAWQWQAARAAPPATFVATRNPFSLAPALGFALFVALLAVVVRWAEWRFGNAGIAVTLAITGGMDVDAAIVTMRGLAPGALDPAVAGMILSLPVLLNTLFKAGIIVTTAGWRIGWRGALPLVASAGVMPIALFATW